MSFAKYIKAGSYLEIYNYTFNKINSKKKSNFAGWDKAMVGDEEYKNERSYMSAKSRIRRLVNCNFVENRSSFLTLTYAENMQDLVRAKIDFLLFIKRLNWSLYKTRSNQLKYLAVHEYQDRGAIHFHIILFDVDRIGLETLRSLWTYGFVKINQLKNCDNVGAYISKYFTKDSNRKKNQKLFYRSFNLQEPVITEVSSDEMLRIEKEVGIVELRYAKSYKDYFGSEISYRQYKISNDIPSSQSEPKF